VSRRSGSGLVCGVGAESTLPFMIDPRSATPLYVQPCRRDRSGHPSAERSSQTSSCPAKPT
jgi:hypothetical protein